MQKTPTDLEEMRLLFRAAAALVALAGIKGPILIADIERVEWAANDLTERIFPSEKEKQ